MDAFLPHNEAEYQKLVGILDSLIDTIGEDEKHSLEALMKVIGVLEKYEDENVPEVTDL